MKTSDLKQWAREHLKGVENCTMPSFTPDLSELDEEGIRWDIRHAIRHGFFSTLCTTEAGLTFEEAKRFVEVAADEAGDDILVSVTVMFDSLEQNIAMLTHARNVGCDTALLGYPPGFYPASPREILSITRKMCEAVPDLAIVLYPSFKYNFHRFHPGGFPLDLLEKMVDFDNAVAMKTGMADLAFIAECFHRFGDRIMVQCPVEEWLPFLIPKFGQTWMGAGPYDVLQSPEKPYLIEYFTLLQKGEFEKAMEIYWRMTPVRKTFFAQMMPMAMPGTYHWPLWKYYQWLVGGNGGFTRQPVMKLHQHDMENIKNALRAVGIAPREPDEEFYVGRVNYRKSQES